MCSQPPGGGNSCHLPSRGRMRWGRGAQSGEAEPLPSRQNQGPRPQIAPPSPHLVCGTSPGRDSALDSGLQATGLPTAASMRHTAPSAQMQTAPRNALGGADDPWGERRGARPWRWLPGCHSIGTKSLLFGYSLRGPAPGSHTAGGKGSPASQGTVTLTSARRGGRAASGVAGHRRLPGPSLHQLSPCQRPLWPQKALPRPGAHRAPPRPDSRAPPARLAPGSQPRRLTGRGHRNPSNTAGVGRASPDSQALTSGSWQHPPSEDGQERRGDARGRVGGISVRGTGAVNTRRERGQDLPTDAHPREERGMSLGRGAGPSAQTSQRWHPGLSPPPHRDTRSPRHKASAAGAFWASRVLKGPFPQSSFSGKTIQV